MKDKHEPHFQLTVLAGGFDAFLETCFTEYQVVASYKYNKDGQLAPDPFMMQVVMYINKHLLPRDVHPIQAIRLMLLEEHYQMSEKWCKAGMFLLCTRDHAYIMRYRVCCTDVQISHSSMK